MGDSFVFEQATRKGVRLRVALVGSSGSGKTYSAMRLAAGIGGRVGLIDTENKRSLYYADEFAFEALHLTPPFSPERFVAAMAASAEAGHDILIVDSASHEWMGPGGILWDLDHMDDRNKFTKWRTLTPRHMAFIDAIIRAPMHLIVNMRGKDMYVLDENNKPEKVGLGPEQRPGLEYEFTVAFNIAQDTHNATATKDNTRLFQDVYERLTEDTGKALLVWAESGEAFEPVQGSNQMTTGAIGTAAAASEKKPAWWTLDADAAAAVGKLGELLRQADDGEASIDAKAWLKKLARRGAAGESTDTLMGELQFKINELEVALAVAPDPDEVANEGNGAGDLALEGQTDTEAAAETLSAQATAEERAAHGEPVIPRDGITPAQAQADADARAAMSSTPPPMSPVGHETPPVVESSSEIDDDIPF